jgi:hypothetical protein
VFLKGTYVITNDGNTLASEVLPKLSLGTWSWAGDSVPLSPGQSHTWEIDTKISKAHLSCEQDPACLGLKLPTKGAFPMVVIRLYKDSSGYQYSAPEVIRLILGNLSDVEHSRVSAPNMNGRFALQGDGHKFAGEFELLSRDVEAREVAVSVVTTEELKVGEGLSKLIVEPVGEQKTRVELENFSGREGSSYPVFTVAQWNDAGVRNVLVRFSSVAIKAVDKSNNYLLLAGVSLVAVMLALLLVLKKPRKKGA